MPDETPRQQAARLRLSGLSVQEVGDLMGLSRQRVHKLTEKEIVSLPGLNLTADEGKRLAQRYEHEKHEGESLPAWLRRLWIGEDQDDRHTHGTDRH